MLLLDASMRLKRNILVDSCRAIVCEIKYHFDEAKHIPKSPQAQFCFVLKSARGRLVSTLGACAQRA